MNGPDHPEVLIALLRIDVVGLQGAHEEKRESDRERASDRQNAGPGITEAVTPDRPDRHRRRQRQAIHKPGTNMDGGQRQAAQRHTHVPASGRLLERVDGERQQDRKHREGRHRERIGHRLLHRQIHQHAEHRDCAAPARPEDGRSQEPDRADAGQPEYPRRSKPQIQRLDAANPGFDRIEGVLHADMPLGFDDVQRRVRILEVEADVAHVPNLGRMRKAVVGRRPTERNRHRDSKEHHTGLEPGRGSEQLPDTADPTRAGEADRAGHKHREIDRAHRADAEMHGKGEGDQRRHDGAGQQIRPRHCRQQPATRICGEVASQQRESWNERRQPEDVKHADRPVA